MIDAIEAAVVAGACRALRKRAASLRKHAADLTTSIEHHGRPVSIAAPEASIALGTARLLEDCAADVTAMIGELPDAVSPATEPKQA